uniref:Uncharacterized protein n=1 Tax=Manihot esculenta TaxID=3983 RepID=A0A251LWH0_MANES
MKAKMMRNRVSIFEDALGSSILLFLSLVSGSASWGLWRAYSCLCCCIEEYF